MSKVVEEASVFLKIWEKSKEMFKPTTTKQDTDSDLEAPSAFYNNVVSADLREKYQLQSIRPYKTDDRFITLTQWTKNEQIPVDIELRTVMKINAFYYGCMKKMLKASAHYLRDSNYGKEYENATKGSEIWLLCHQRLTNDGQEGFLRWMKYPFDDDLSKWLERGVSCISIPGPLHVPWDDLIMDYMQSWQRRTQRQIEDACDKIIHRDSDSDSMF